MNSRGLFRKLMRGLAVAISIVILCICPLLIWMNSFGPQIIVDESFYFAFNPDTVLHDLEAGNENALTQISQDDWLGDCCIQRPEAGAVRWTFTDFLSIAAAVHQSTWGEGIETWSLEKMYFDFPCEWAEFGPQMGRFWFFREDWKGLDARYFESYFTISPQRGHVISSRVIDAGTSHRLPFVGLPHIDLERLMVTPELALQMTEANGGPEARAFVGKDCFVLIRFNPSNNEDGWSLRYYEEEDAPFETIKYQINAYDGTMIGPVGLGDNSD